MSSKDPATTQPDPASQTNGHAQMTDGQESQVKKKRGRSTPCNIGCGAWCRKYFCEGQALSEEQVQALDEVSDDDPLFTRIMVRHRRIVGMLLPASIFHFLWWSVMIKYNFWHLFTEKYFMSITMIFGSMVAGMTSEGGGAIAFPVMTLAFSIPPSIARDFSLMIQACGMSAAAFTIFFMRVTLEFHSIALCSIGGAIGMILGLHFVDPYLTPPQKKMGFVSIWFSFAFALFLLNRNHKRRTFTTIPNVNAWKMIVLVITGIFGGIFSAFAGSGVDICSFSILTILFRVSEKIATPTSVVLMGLNTCLGFFWRQVIMQEVSQEAWEFLCVCVPIVVLGAPLGSVIGTHFHRQVLAAMVYIIDTAALIGAFVLIKQTAALAGASVGIIVGGFIFFFFLTRLGNRMLTNIEKDMRLAPTGGGPHDKEMQSVDVKDTDEPKANGAHENVAFDNDHEKTQL